MIILDKFGSNLHYLPSRQIKNRLRISTAIRIKLMKRAIINALISIFSESEEAESESRLNEGYKGAFAVAHKRFNHLKRDS